MNRAAPDLGSQFSLTDLLTVEFESQQWVVPGVIPEGLTVLGGKPKVGKSWLALDLAIGVAGGSEVLGGIEVAQGDVLYLALEDTARRLQQRTRMVLGGREPPGALQFGVEWTRLDDLGLGAIRAWAHSVEAPRLVVIDTWAKVRPETSNRRLYDDDYEAIGPLQQFTGDTGVAVIVVHHLRKGDADDWVDAVSGTTGITGAVDSVVVLFRERSRGDATLRGIGRDMDEYEQALAFDPACGRWRILGDAGEYRLSQERAEILDVVDEMGPVRPKEVAEVLNRSEGSTRKLMAAMAKDGLLKPIGGGLYTTPGNTGNSGNSALPVLPLLPGLNEDTSTVAAGVIAASGG